MSHVRVSLSLDHTWRYASGDAMQRFCEGLRERRLEALQCEGCQRRYLPPRPLCGDCRRLLKRWVTVRDTGTLVAWTVVHLPIVDSRTGDPRPTPYGMGLIRLDGADTTLNHYLHTSDPDALRIGLRVRALWRDELRGAMDDILAFEVIP
jgi:uncharacterized OB-fold protein